MWIWPGEPSESSKHLDASKLDPAGMVGESMAVGAAQSPIVLIDDDRLMIINWTHHCKKNNLPFTGFKSINEFLAVSENFDKQTRIYIDSNLVDGIKGEIESEKIFALGFLNLY